MRTAFASISLAGLYLCLGALSPVSTAQGPACTTVPLPKNDVCGLYLSDGSTCIDKDVKNNKGTGSGVSSVVVIVTWWDDSTSTATLTGGQTTEVHCRAKEITARETVADPGSVDVCPHAG